MGSIYQITNKVNNKRYIGSAKNFLNRKNKHLYELRKNNHKNIYLQNSYNKYGEDKFEFKIIEDVELENLIIREQWWLDNLKPEYNICKIAGSSLGVKRREETKLKCSLAHIGEKHPEWRNKIKSLAQGGKNHWTKKKKFSIDSKIRMSQAQKKLYENGYKSPSAKPISQFTKDNLFVRDWESAAQAEKLGGFSNKAITNCVTGRTKSSGNFIWRYKNNV